VSLDAAKAFDKLWRAGLFHKLIGKISEASWRAIYAYYQRSQIVVSHNGERGPLTKTEEGVKQGGILSPHLFNFYINQLLLACTDLDIGAKVGGMNVSVVAYCDDILLMSPVSSHIDRLLKECSDYASKWKLEFNSKKSEHFVSGPRSSECKVRYNLNQSTIPRVDGMVYLGLPIGDQQYVDNFFTAKFGKVERSMYSLRLMGCKPLMLNPNSVAYIYKQYCQSQCKYGLETLHISVGKQKEIEVRQNILVKNAIGVGKYARTTPLFQSLRIESFAQIYQKHKLFFYKQIKNNQLVFNLFSFLKVHYANNKLSERSFVAQLDEVERFANAVGHAQNVNEMIAHVEQQHKCDNIVLVDSVTKVINEMYRTAILDELNALVIRLKDLLNYTNI
jgi:hypothetical protein